MKNMEKTTLKNANDFLKEGNSDLQFVLKKTALLRELDEHFKLHIDPKFRELCVVANMINNHLIVLTANSSIATTLHFQSNELLKKLRQDSRLKLVNQISFKVRTNTIYSESLTDKKKLPPTLSQATAKMIYETSTSITDPQLREIMQRISMHTKK